MILMKNVCVVNIRLEKWEKEAIKKGGPMDEISKVVYKLRGLPELVKIRCGFLIKEMLNRFTWKVTPVNGTLPELALYFYSGHSSTITTLMNGLGLDQVTLIHMYSFELTY